MTRCYCIYCRIKKPSLVLEVPQAVWKCRVAMPSEMLSMSTKPEKRNEASAERENIRSYYIHLDLIYEKLSTNLPSSSKWPSPPRRNPKKNGQMLHHCLQGLIRPKRMQKESSNVDKFLPCCFLPPSLRARPQFHAPDFGVTWDCLSFSDVFWCFQHMFCFQLLSVGIKTSLWLRAMTRCKQPAGLSNLDWSSMASVYQKMHRRVLIKKRWLMYVNVAYPSLSSVIIPFWTRAR